MLDEAPYAVRLSDQESTASATRSRILVVDDEPDILDLCRRLLSKSFDIVVAQNAEEGLELARHEHFSVAIVDQSLPVTDGIEFVSRLQVISPETGRIVITGAVSQDKVIEAINKGKVNAYILKPWNAEEFTGIVQREVAVAQLRQSLLQEKERYRRLVYDDVCNLPTRQLIEGTGAEWLETASCLGVLVVDASKLWSVQREYGGAVFHDIRQQFLELLRELAAKCLRTDDLLATDEVDSPRFVFILSQPRTAHLVCSSEVARIARRLQEALSTRILRLRMPSSGWWPHVTVGHGFVLHNPITSARHQVREAVQAARDHARRALDSGEDTNGRTELERIIARGDIATVFQVVVDVTTGKPIGVEALSRGPAGSDYEPPLVLLRMADLTGLSVELDHAFRVAVLRSCGRIPAPIKTFVNVMPQTLIDPAMSGKRICDTLTKYGLEPDRLVVEVSERYVIHNRDALKATLREYQQAGIGVAIDDVGVGYSGLERIVEFRPDYLKIDISLVQHIHREKFKQSTVNALLKIASDIGALTIAEGVEQPEELECLRALGVSLAQGYLLGRPTPSPVLDVG